MKYYTLTLSKFSTVFFVSFLFTLAYAQKGTQSPYSVFGIGELNQGEYAGFAGMANVSLANSDSTMVNNNNPASYVYFNRYRPVFQVGLNGKYSQYSTQTNSSSQQHFGLNQFQLGLPIKKNWGAAFGLSPYSFTGYTITNFIVEDDDTIGQNVNEGSGAISKVFLGIAYKPLNFSKLDTNYSKSDTTYAIKSHFLSIGVHGNYLFGNSTKTQSYEYLVSQSAYNSRVNSSLRLSDFNVDFGFMYQYYFRKAYSDSTANGSISIAGAYSPGVKMKSYQDVFSHSYLGSFYSASSSLLIVDTVELVDDNAGFLYIPEQFKAGIEYRIGWNPSRKGERLLRIGAEVNYQKWSAYYQDFGAQEFQPYYKDRMKMALGIEFCPLIGNDPSINILARTNYRFGIQYTQTELNVNATSLTNYGMTFGFGIPVNVNVTNTNINFGASYGNMGTVNNGLINERYLGFYFGVSIIPDRNELWFVKRKYD